MAFTLVLVLAVAVAGYLAYRHAQSQLGGCEADGGGSSGSAVMLAPGQAAIAATIAGVAHARSLPAGAVTIAYATAMQESHLQNLPDGDLDSVGVFQQRPSQGWGTPQELQDPVYATGKFFAALVKVPNYLRIPIDQAAQDVQHSADGAAYENYAKQAAGMSGPFTGQAPHAVWCWYPQGTSAQGGSATPGAAQQGAAEQGAAPQGAAVRAAGGHQASPAATTSPQIASMRQELVHTFGQLDVQRSTVAADVGAQVRVGYRAAGWAVASWLVTHATEYGITDVLYAGYQWSEAAGSKGWTRDPTAPWGRVELR
jgi:hypothetical protein